MFFCILYQWNTCLLLCYLLLYKLNPSVQCKERVEPPHGVISQKCLWHRYRSHAVWEPIPEPPLLLRPANQYDIFGFRLVGICCSTLEHARIILLLWQLCYILLKETGRMLHSELQADNVVCCGHLGPTELKIQQRRSKEAQETARRSTRTTRSSKASLARHPSVSLITQRVMLCSEAEQACLPSLVGKL